MKLRRGHLVLIVALAVSCAGVVVFRSQLRDAAAAIMQRLRGRSTVSDRVAQYGGAARERLGPRFEAAGVPYPPEEITLVGLKEERRLEVWVRASDSQWQHLKTYPILGMSGKVGPKLRHGDRQVPEGIYRVDSLNPNSSYHLSLRLNYPNGDDRRRAESEGRTDLGADIMIHGGNVSVGCLAMGDEAAEDLFVLVAETGIENVSVILSPVDFRVRDLPQQYSPVPEWVPDLYESIRKELSKRRGDCQEAGTVRDGVL